MVHAYSLNHDDLTAMDDSDLRRGRATCHKAIDEATAVLAGDGLLTMAFEDLSHPDTHGNPSVRCELVAALAAAAGSAGMVGGQMIDMIAETHDARYRRDHPAAANDSTGALIAFACEAGAILAKAPHEMPGAQRLRPRPLDFAFQIADDLLDVEGSGHGSGDKAKPVEAPMSAQSGESHVCLDTWR